MLGTAVKRPESTERSGALTIRILDLVLAFVLLVLATPILLVAGVAIKLESPGPVFFTQSRVGRYNRLFTLYKLRSMRVGAPEVAKGALVTDLGAYVTKVGAVLRRTSIDELPQLLNVVKGDMSLVGPRPALYNQHDLIRLRTDVGAHLVRPGITGIAQVMGREDIPLKEKVAYDRTLVMSLSPGLYVRLLGQTVVAVFTTRGAY